MLAFAYFLLKATICSAALFGYYWFFLRNKAFHSYNRFYLLAIVVLSVTLPLMKINVFHKAAEPKTNIIKMLQVVTVSDVYMDEVIISPKKNNMTVSTLLPFVYMLVSGVLLLMMLQMLAHIAAILRKNKVMLIGDIHFVNTDNAKGTPFSFFKYIFWNRQIDMQSPAGTRIFKHEVAHIQERHSWDKIFINTILIAFWINPVFWLIRRELDLIHEFIADKKAVEDGDTAAFADMILAAAYPQQRIGITNNFFYSPVKRRLMMLTKNQNPKMNYISRLLVLPLAVVVFAAFTLKAKTIGDTKSNNTITNKITSFLTNKNTSPSIIESNEPGGNTAQALFPTERKIRVVLDAGHGGKDNGARNEDGSLEKDLALRLIKKVKAMNKNENIEIILTRDNDTYQNPKEKAAFANAQNADLFLSVHLDAAMTSEAQEKTGMKVFISKSSFSNSEKSRVFASAIIGRFENNYGLAVTPSPYQREAGIWVLQSCDMPSALIQAGFISNNKDIAYIKSEKGQEAFATNVLNALNDYAAGKYTLAPNNQSPEDAANKDAAEKGESTSVTASSVDISKATLPAYIIVDGKRSSEAAVRQMSPESLKSVTLLDSDKATEKYGADAGDGALEIITKNGTQQKGRQNEIFTKAEKEAEFPGGKDAYSTFLQKNLDANIPVTEGWKPGTYTVFLRFVVNANGKLSRIQTENYTGSKTAAECIDLMKKSPDWTPAMQNGKAVTSYKRQPITFVLEEEKDENKAAFIDPVFRVGNLNKGVVDAGAFKKEHLLTVTDGYRLVQATVYFTGSGFPQPIKTVIESDDLSQIKSLLDKCGPGTNIVFDNVRVKGEKGLMAIDGKVYTLK